MCFSAEASFTSAAVLSGIGLLTVNSAQKRSLLLIAIIPFLFAMQQLAEGIIWLSFNESMTTLAIISAAKYFFLLFAFIMWPIWVPLSLITAEEVPWRRKVLLIFLATGLTISFYFISYLPGNEISARIVNLSIQYNLAKPFAVNNWLLIGSYSLVVLVPFFVSSLRLIWGFGILSLFSWLIAEFFYNDTFSSTWCFFSAILSAYLYPVIKANSASKETHKE